MYYDDRTRRFNLMSGLVFGAALGAGLALLYATRSPAARRVAGRAAGALRRAAGEGAGAVAGRAGAGASAVRRRFEL